MLQKSFGDACKKLREKENISQEKFALRIGMDRTYYASVEAGKRNISIQNIKGVDFMSKFFIDLIDSLGNVIDTDDEVFDNESDAEDYADECNNAFAIGAEDSEGKDDYMDPNEYEYVVREE